MKKIMFNEKYGLQQAVLEGRKTMTRRIVPDGILRMANLETRVHGRGLADCINDHSPLLYLDTVAIAQKYWDLRNDSAFYEQLQKSDPTFPLECIRGEKGCHNKMFVNARWMPHAIRITNVKVERLQDISEEDAMREGIFKYDKPPLHHEYDMFAPWPPYVKPYKHDNDNLKYKATARYAFAYLIDKLSGAGTWNSNPWVYAYTFELVR